VNTNTVPLPIAVQPLRLDLTGLQTAYEWKALSVTLGLQLAIEWYANNITMMIAGAPLDSDQIKTYDRALKAKALGENNTSEGEKAQALTTAIRLFEKLWAMKNSLPLVDAAAPQKGQHVQDVMTVLGNLNGAFAVSGTKFRITFNADREFLNGEVLIPSAELDQMIGHPPLKTVLGEVPTVTQVLSIVTDEEGTASLDGVKYIATLPTVLSNVYDWAAKAGRLMKPVGKVPKAGRASRKAATPGAPRPAAGPRAPKVSPHATIHVINLGLVRVGGKRMVAINVLRDGMTLADYKQALQAIGLRDYVGWAVSTAQARGAITVS
jgi:hypothetical protein